MFVLVTGGVPPVSVASHKHLLAGFQGDKNEEEEYEAQKRKTQEALPRQVKQVLGKVNDSQTSQTGSR